MIATGSDNEGVVRLLEGFGFSVGFFLVAKLRLLAARGNMTRALVLGHLIAYTSDYDTGVEELLGEVMSSKMRYIPVLVTVMAFVAGGFLHSPANVAHLSLTKPSASGRAGAMVY